MDNICVLNKRKHKNSFTPLTCVMLVFLIVFAIILFSLLIFTLINSIKDMHDFDGDAIGYIGANRISFPRVFINSETGMPYFIENFLAVINFSIRIEGKPMYYEEMLLNTIIYSVGGSFVQTLVCFTTAYMCARYKGIVSTIILNIAIVTMAIPIVGNTAATIDVLDKIHLLDTMPGMLILKANFLGTYFLVFYATFKVMPKDYFEAGTIDGASDLGNMLRIGFPLAKGEFLTVFLINFIALWNDYETAHIYIRNKPTLAYQVWLIVFGNAGSLLNGTPAQLMACLMLLLPVLILFLVFQKRLLKNLSVGGIKG